MAGPRLRTGRQGLPTPAHKMKKSYISSGYKGNIGFNIRDGQVEQKAEATADGKTRSGGCAADHTGLAKDEDRERTDPMTTGLEKRRQKKPVAGHDGPGNMDRRAAARIKTAGKGQAHAGMTATQGLPEGVSGLPPCAGWESLPDAFPRDPGQDDGAFSRNRHS